VSAVLCSRGKEAKERIEPVCGICLYYAFWWQDKTVQKKALTNFLAETLAPLLLGIDLV
jgi:hypothetical protein